MMKIAVPDPPLADDEIVLRLWGDGDIPAIVTACGEEEIVRWLDQLPHPYRERDAREYIAQTRRGWREATASSFAITVRGRNEAVGSIGVHWLDHDQGVAEVGYWVAPQVRRNGVATRALRLVAGWVLGECAAERLQLRAEVENAASCGVAEKGGFRREGILRSVRFNERLGRRADFVMYSLLPGELDGG
jgi:RimJ/RimL family protein N-acetyltransferase